MSVRSTRYGAYGEVAADRGSPGVAAGPAAAGTSAGEVAAVRGSPGVAAGPAAAGASASAVTTAAAATRGARTASRADSHPIRITRNLRHPGAPVKASRERDGRATPAPGAALSAC